MSSHMQDNIMHSQSAMSSHRFIKEGEMKAEYPIVIGGENFGCGSSREHAPVCMGAAGNWQAGCLTQTAAFAFEAPASSAVLSVAHAVAFHHCWSNSQQNSSTISTHTLLFAFLLMHALLLLPAIMKPGKTYNQRCIQKWCKLSTLPVVRVKTEQHKQTRGRQMCGFASPK